MEDNSTWKDVIRLKYHTDEGDWLNRAPRGSFRVGLRKDINKESRQLKQDIRFMVGDGTRISFWEDNWCGDKPLCDAFPSLFALACSKRAKVAEVWDLSRGEGAWMPTFVRPFNDWELDIVQNFFCLINKEVSIKWRKTVYIGKGAKMGCTLLKRAMSFWLVVTQG